MSGGIEGKVITLGGTATTTVTPVAIPSPYKRLVAQPGRTSFLKSLVVTNLDATNDLLIYLNDAATPAFRVKANDEAGPIEGNIFKIAVQSSAATVAWSAVGAAA